MNKIVIGIVEKDRQFLLVRRRQPEGNLHWQFPGGKIEEGESETMAVEREILEEVDLLCMAVRKLGEREHPASKRTISYWLCSFVSGEAVVKDREELDSVEWATAPRVFERITSEIFQPVKQYIQMQSTSEGLD